MPRSFSVRKGERGVVRGNPLALWRWSRSRVFETAVASGVASYDVRRAALVSLVVQIQPCHLLFAASQAKLDEKQTQCQKSLRA